MAHKYSIHRYRNWYARLLRLYPKPYRERFSEGMEQSFNDLLQERAGKEGGLFDCALWMFIETSTGIIRERKTVIIMQNKNIIRIVLGTGFVLLMPLVAMQFTEEVNWKIGDFIVMGILLFSAGLAYELLTRKLSTTTYRIAVGIAIGILFLLIWAELAVGIFGTPFAGS